MSRAASTPSWISAATELADFGMSTSACQVPTLASSVRPCTVPLASLVADAQLELPLILNLLQPPEELPQPVMERLLR